MPTGVPTPAISAGSNTFTVTDVVTNVQNWLAYIFSDGGPIDTVVDFVIAHPFVWVFLGLSICTIGIKLLTKIRRMF